MSQSPPPWSGCALSATDHECDEVLLHGLMQLSLDQTAVGVGIEDEVLQGRVQLPDLDAQPVELPPHVDLPILQVDQPRKA